LHGLRRRRDRVQDVVGFGAPVRLRSASRGGSADLAEQSQKYQLSQFDEYNNTVAG
jgi:hypothetical protein